MTTDLAAFGEPSGQGLTQLGELLVALLLSSLIGLERQLKQKSAGLRTHTLVGLGAALFMLVSKYGFTDVLDPGRVVVDPSRVAAQIVSGIGFIGGGLIFVRRDVVRGLTTAAVVWVTAAVGSACGAGLPVLGVVVTGAHFLVAYGYPPLLRRLTRQSSIGSASVRLRYLDGHGVLRDVLGAATRLGFSVVELDSEKFEEEPHPPSIDLMLRVTGRADPTELAAALSELDGVRAVRIEGDEE
ncbi:MAG TPA: MgtC/SapB family protein [Pseudonocardiaceae bacterium]|jgi:putative Mg2+ transporter-C (MgtC) family protein|nr:MgtC/SapB family protein [Pseudonocardiaceae bacterium]